MSENLGNLGNYSIGISVEMDSLTLALKECTLAIKKATDVMLSGFSNLSTGITKASKVTTSALESTDAAADRIAKRAIARYKMQGDAATKQAGIVKRAMEENVDAATVTKGTAFTPSQFKGLGTAYTKENADASKHFGEELTKTVKKCNAEIGQERQASITREKEFNSQLIQIERKRVLIEKEAAAEIAATRAKAKSTPNTFSSAEPSKSSGFYQSDGYKKGMHEATGYFKEEEKAALRAATAEEKASIAATKAAAAKVKAAAAVVLAENKVASATEKAAAKSILAAEKSALAMDKAAKKTADVGVAATKAAAGTNLLSGVMTAMTTTLKYMMAYQLLGWFQQATVGSVEFAGKLEMLKMQFKGLSGSMAGSKDMYQQLQDYAVASPFRIPELADNAKKLLAVGFATGEVVPKLKMLGDVAMGDNDKLGRLTNAYERVAAKGRASLRELNMFIYAGVPIMQELAKNMGITESKVYEYCSKGKIGFSDVDEALKTLTGDTGKFHDMMLNQAKTLPGMMSILGDQIDITSANITTLFLPNIKKAVQGMIDFTDATYKATKGLADFMTNNPQFLSNLKTGVQWTGLLSTSLILIGTSAIPKLLGSLAKIGPALIGMIEAIKLACWTNPWLALAVIVGTVVVGAFMLHKKAMNESVVMINQINATTDKQVNKTTELAGRINYLAGIENKSKEQKKELNDSIYALCKMYPQYESRIKEEIRLHGKLTEQFAKEAAAAIFLARAKDIANRQTKLNEQTKFDKAFLTPFARVHETINSSALQGNDARRAEAKRRLDSPNLGIRSGKQKDQDELSKLTAKLTADQKKVEADFVKAMNGSGADTSTHQDSTKAGGGGGKSVANDDSFKTQIANLEKETIAKHDTVMNGLKETEEAAIQEDNIRKEMITKGKSEYDQFFKEELALRVENAKKEKGLILDNEKDLKKALETLEIDATAKINKLKHGKAKNAADVIGKVQVEAQVEANRLIKMYGENLEAEKTQLHRTTDAKIAAFEINTAKSVAEIRRQLNAEIATSSSDYEISTARQTLQHKMNLGLMSQRQYFKELRVLQEQEAAKDLIGVDSKIAAKSEPTSKNYDKNYKSGNIDFDKDQQERTQILQKNSLARQSVIAQETESMTAKYASCFDSMSEGFTKAFGDMFMGVTTVSDGITAMTGSIKSAFSSLISSMVKDWVKGITTMVIQHVTGNATMQAATITTQGVTTGAAAATVASNTWARLSNIFLAGSHGAIAGAAGLQAGAQMTATKSTLASGAAAKVTTFSFTGLIANLTALAIPALKIASAFGIIALSTLAIAVGAIPAALGLGLMAVTTALAGLAAKFAAPAVGQLAVSMAALSAAAIPVVGWAMAPLAAEATGIGIKAGVAAIPKFAKGADNIPRDMVAQVHQGERIMTNQENSKFTNYMNSLDNQESQQSNPVIVQVNAMDAKSFMDQIDKVTDRISSNIEKKRRRFK